MEWKTRAAKKIANKAARKVGGMMTMPRLHQREEDTFAFSGLHWMAAGLFIAAGAQAALSQGRKDSSQRVPGLVRWAPLVAAPLAGAAHAVRAARPTTASRAMSRVLDGLAVGVGAAGVASAIYGAQRERAMTGGWPGSKRRAIAELGASLAPLTFGFTGILGMILDREEEQDSLAHRRLEKRARIVERLVPKRKPKLDRIVVHI
jgi:hypothetical protein